MINSKGQCNSCGRDYEGEQLEGQVCPADDDCPSHFEEVGKVHPEHPDYNMNQLEQFLIELSGTSPEKWKGNKRYDGDEDLTIFDFQKFHWSYQCDLDVYCSRADFALIPNENKVILLGFHRELGKLALGWMGPDIKQYPESLQRFHDELDWAIEFDFMLSEAPAVIKGKAPTVLMTSNISGNSLCQIAASLKLNMYLFLGIEQTYDKPDRVIAYENSWQCDDYPEE